MKKLWLWLFDLMRYAEQSMARKFYEMSGDKLLNYVTGSTLFQSNVSVNVFKVQIYILKQIKISTIFFILQEMKV